MDAVLAQPLSPSPDFGQVFNLVANAIKAASSKLVFRPAQIDASHEDSTQTQRGAEEFFAIIDILADHLPEAMAECEKWRKSPGTRQRIILMDYLLRYIHFQLVLMAGKLRPMLTGTQREQLKDYIAIVKNFLPDFGRMKGQPENTGASCKALEKINGIRLTMPLRLIIEDDADGKHVSCPELPQLYGFGDTEQDAIEMLEREILSLRNDVRSSPNIAEEYKYAADLIDLALLYEK